MNTTKELIPQLNTANKQSDAFAGLREKALESFNKLGFPTTRHEEWKYTNVNSIIANNLEFNHRQAASRVTSNLVDQHRMAGSKARVLVFENGLFLEHLSDQLPEVTNFIISNIISSVSNQVMRKHLGNIAEFNDEAFVALNTAFAEDGLFIHLSPGTIVDFPVHFMHFNSTGSEQGVSSVRVLVVAEKNSKISLVQSFHSATEVKNGFANCVTEILVAEQAHVELVNAQLESELDSHINFTQVIQERNSTFDTVTITLGGALVRNNLHIKLNDENCTSHLFGLYIPHSNQLVDNHTLVDHAKPHCFSNELYKGILNGSSTGVFNGKVFVREDAQKTNAYQSNKNILLSDEAQLNTKPQLEIYADDVKCTHGATIGQMDEDALFYLRARGIGEQKAKALLNIAFASDVLNNIKIADLRQHLQMLAEHKLNR